jgi:hypothetical protein
LEQFEQIKLYEICSKIEQKLLKFLFCKKNQRKNCFSVATGGPQPASARVALCGRQTVPLALAACFDVAHGPLEQRRLLSGHPMPIGRLPARIGRDKNPSTSRQKP